LRCHRCFTKYLLAFWSQRRGIGVATIQGLAGAYGNIGYLGPPLALAAFGPEAGVPVALLFSLENTMHFIIAPLLLSFTGTQAGVSVLTVVWGIVKRITTHPFILATAAGILAAYHEVRLPAATNQLIDSLASAAAPCALFSMGVTAALRPLKRVPIEISYIVPIKLLVHPIVMFWVLSAIPGANATWVLTAVLLASLPTATNVFVLAQQYQTWQEQASSMVVITTALSMLSVTGFLYLAGAG